MARTLDLWSSNSAREAQGDVGNGCFVEGPRKVGPHPIQCRPIFSPFLGVSFGEVL